MASMADIFNRLGGYPPQSEDAQRLWMLNISLISKKNRDGRGRMMQQWADYLDGLKFQLKESSSV